MAKMTLLEMTQNILSSMNSDEVNSITDTVESQQVAEEIRTTFNELYSNRDFAELEGVIQLEASPDDVFRPNAMMLPAGVQRLKWVKYLDYRAGNNPRYKKIEYLDPEEFIKRVVEESTSDYKTYTTVPLLYVGGPQYTIPTDRSPRFYTIFHDLNEDYLTFDAIDFEVEGQLSPANCLAWGIKTPEFQMYDSFTPHIPDNLFPHFLAEAKSACFINIKEIANSKEEQRARRQLVRSQFRLQTTNAERKGVFDAIDYSRKR